MTKNNNEQPKPIFGLEDIQDVKITIKANNKHYVLTPDETKASLQECRKIRIQVLIDVLFQTHGVPDISLEELLENKI